jgi:PAS domain-containing protein
MADQAGLWRGGAMSVIGQIISCLPLEVASAQYGSRLSSQEALHPRFRSQTQEQAMPQQSIEVILMRQLASYLAMPILLVDPAGTLLFYNKPAEGLLGQRYEETGELLLTEWTHLFRLTTEDGSPLALEARPLLMALQQHRVVHGAFWIQDRDGVARKIEATAFPLEGQGRRQLGAVAIFWQGRAP